MVNKSHVRAHIRQNSEREALSFVNMVSLQSDRLVIENYDGDICVDAKSVLGVIYAMADFNDSMYLVNKTQDGRFSFDIDKFRV